MGFQRNRKSYTQKQAMVLAAKLCATRERSHHEIKQKLWEYGLNEEEADEVLVELIQGGFVSEKRFAQAYARGKFNQLSWGRIKIQGGLKEQDIPKKLIDMALKEIDSEDYFQRLTKLLTKKKKDNQGMHYLKLKKKLLDYALQKGYERNLIFRVLEDLETKK